MDYNQLISKKALDKENNELGIIVRIDKLPHILHKRIVPHLIISKKIRRRKSVSIPVHISEIEMVKGDNVHLKISAEYFNKEAERRYLIAEESGRYKGFVSNISNWVGGSNVDRRPKNRKE